MASARRYRSILLSLLAVLMVGQAWAVPTITRIRSEGVLRIGMHSADHSAPRARQLEAFAASLDTQAVVVRFDRFDGLLDALSDGDIDLIGTPLDRQRPLPLDLAFSIPVDQARVILAGDSGPVAVRYGGDEWHRALALREQGQHLALEIRPAGMAAADLLANARNGTEGRALLMTTARDIAGTVLAPDQPRSWLYRSADRVLGFKVDRFIQDQALLREARSRQIVPEAALIRAQLRDGAITPYDDLARSYGRFYGVDWRLILAIMYVESRFDPEALSTAGAQGLMQLKPIAARQVGIGDVSQPSDNVLAGVRYLTWARDRFDADLDPAERLWFALAAYNGGLSRIEAAQRRAQREGRNPRLWQGNVSRALLALAADRGDFNAEVVVDYVSKVQRRFAAYVRVTEGPPALPLAETSGGFTAP